MNNRLQALRRRALLVPTPLCFLDQAGEARREAEVDQALGFDQAPLTADESALLETAKRESDGAQLIDSRARSTLSLPNDRCRHPLSAQDLQPVAPAPTWWATQSPQWLGPNHRDAWLSFVVDPITRGLPSDPVLPDVPVWSQRSLAAALVAARHGGGEAALLLMHLGPVGRFIQAARRTQDLWIGSYLVAFHALQMMAAVIDEAGPEALLSPFLADNPLAQRLIFGQPLDPANKVLLLRAANPNRLVALVPLSDAPRIAQAAADRARLSWQAFADTVKSHIKAKGAVSDSDLQSWDDQIRTHLEIDAVIQPWPGDRAALRHALLPDELPLDMLVKPPGGTSDAYGPLFRATHNALAAARLTNPPLETAGDQRPKCTLAGDREQMGPIGPEREVQAFWDNLSQSLQTEAGGGRGEGRSSLALPLGEGLSAVSLTRRLAAEAVLGGGASAPLVAAPLNLDWKRDPDGDRCLLRFPSIGSIASAPFRRRLKLEQEGGRIDLSAWIKAVEAVNRTDLLDFEAPGNLLPGLGDIGRDDPLLRQDGDWFYEEAYEAARAWRDHHGCDASPAELARLEPAMRATWREWKHATGSLTYGPSDYYAIVRLDGDGMGDWLTGRHPRMPSLNEALRPLSHPALTRHEDEARRVSPPRPLFPALHGELSRRVANQGTDTIPRVIERWLGRMIYSGGDDLLAFMPLETLLPCLIELDQKLKEVSTLGNRVDFSGGVVMTHRRQPLQRALRLAHKAEKKAKEHAKAHATSGALRFCCFPRSGDDMSFTLGRQVGREDLLELLWELATATNDGERALKPSLGFLLQREAKVLLDLKTQDPKCLLDRLCAEVDRAEVLRLGALIPQGLAAIDLEPFLLFARFLARELPLDRNQTSYADARGFRQAVTHGTLARGDKA
jgi:hypothetical protein